MIRLALYRAQDYADGVAAMARGERLTLGQHLAIIASLSAFCDMMVEPQLDGAAFPRGTVAGERDVPIVGIYEEPVAWWSPERPTPVEFQRRVVFRASQQIMRAMRFCAVSEETRAVVLGAPGSGVGLAPTPVGVGGMGAWAVRDGHAQQLMFYEDGAVTPEIAAALAYIAGAAPLLATALRNGTAPQTLPESLLPGAWKAEQLAADYVNGRRAAYWWTMGAVAVLAVLGVSIAVYMDRRRGRIEPGAGPAGLPARAS